MTEKKDYPKMLFHVVEEPIVVKDLEEEKKYTSVGWRETSEKFDAYNLIKAKIVYHESQIELLVNNLNKIKAEENINDESLEVKRKPGRPRKEEA